MQETSTVVILNPIQSILIYTGHQIVDSKLDGNRIIKGPFLESVDKHFSLINDLNIQRGFPWKIQPVLGNHLDLILNAIKADETLLIIPAGECAQLDRVFSDEQLEAIKNALARGLRVLSTGGSAYWMCEERVWHDVYLEKLESWISTQKKSRIAIFKGRAEGPLSPCPDMKGRVCFHDTVEVTNGKLAIRVLVSGSGAFFPANEHLADTQIIAAYSDEELQRLNKDSSWRAAAVKCRYGRGMAILSMIHPGYGYGDAVIDRYKSSSTNNKTDLQSVRDHLSPFEDRIAFAEALLQEFEIPFN